MSVYQILGCGQNKTNDRTLYLPQYIYVHQRPNTALNDGKCCREDPTDIGGPTDP
jgi:hypothetical protein